MRVRKLQVSRTAPRAVTVVGIGIAVVFAGIYYGFVPAYVVWLLTDFNDLSRWLEWYQGNPQVHVQHPVLVWEGTIRGLIVELASAHSILLVGAITVFCGVRILRRERLRQRIEATHDGRPALAS